MISCLLGWIRRFFRRTDAHTTTPSQPDLAAIAAKYQEHDIIIARLRDRERRVQKANDILTHGKPSGNQIADIFTGTWPPRHRRRAVKEQS